MERRGAFVRWSGPMALGVEQARPPPPIGARSPFQRPPGAPRGLLMAVLKWASTGLGWGGGLSRLRTPSAAPWDGDSTQKLPPAAYSTASQPLPPPQGLYYRPYCAASYWQPGGRAPRAPRRAHGSQSSNEYCRPAASRLPGGSTRLARRAPADLAAAPAAAALAAAAPAGGRHGRRRPLHPRLPSRAPSRRARPTLLAHGTRRHTAAENRRCSARSARDLVLLRLDPAIPRVYL